VYNAHNKKFEKHLSLYILKKKLIFTKNSNILFKKSYKDKKYVKYIKNIPICMQKSLKIIYLEKIV